ncbi:hypothetical protein E3E12_01285 [Formicincola oecophyllae]|uniref:Uncharacterized protein n=1 Tax=Formicincola oecophyllae TaxID=2558361 RepID=A0A4Y6U7A9_9PROT|nr:hypothetical protein [Formicincola oecophyllae]QDH13054.1 hypothetical protein E3E12_01285 [Formicincola oecophyllae]
MDDFTPPAPKPGLRPAPMGGFVANRAPAPAPTQRPALPDTIITLNPGERAALRAAIMGNGGVQRVFWGFASRVDNGGRMRLTDEEVQWLRRQLAPLPEGATPTPTRQKLEVIFARTLYELDQSNAKHGLSGAPTAGEPS